MGILDSIAKGIHGGAKAGADMYKKQAEDNRKLFMQKHLQEEGYKEARKVAATKEEYQKIRDARGFLQKEREMSLQYGYTSANREDAQKHEVGRDATSFGQTVSIRGMDANIAEDVANTNYGRDITKLGMQQKFSEDQANTNYGRDITKLGMQQKFSEDQANTNYGRDITKLGMQQKFSEDQANTNYARDITKLGMQQKFSEDQANTNYARDITKLGMQQKHKVDLQTQTALAALYENNAHVGHKHLSGFNDEVSDAVEIVYSESYKDFRAAQISGSDDSVTETEWGGNKAALTAAVSKNVKELRGGLYGAKIGLDYNVSAAELVSLIANAPIDAQGDASFYVPIVKRRALKGYYDSYSDAIGRAGSRLKSADALAKLPEDQRKDWEALNAEMQKTQRRLAKKFLHTTGIPFSPQGLPAIWSK